LLISYEELRLLKIKAIPSDDTGNGPHPTATREDAFALDPLMRSPTFAFPATLH
jgi:hypothetical protein